MNIRLEIEANSPDQLRRVLAEILGAGVVASATEFTESGEDAVAATGLPIFAESAPAAPAAEPAAEPAKRGRKKAAAENPPPPPAGETSTTNETPPAPPAPPPADAPPPPVNAPTVPPPPAPPASPATTTPASPSTGEITVDSLRNLMASVMAAAPAGKGVPASTVQAALKAACGGIGSIAQLVPEQYSNAHAALSAL